MGGIEISAAQPTSIFGNAVSNNPIDDPGPVTLRVKFWSSQPGTIAGIRFYRAAANSQGYVAKLYTASGTLLGSTTIARESGPLPGWQEADFASPIPISANTTYVAAYYCSVGQGAWDAFGLTNGVTNGPLTSPASGAVGGNGVYDYGNVFPSSSFAGQQLLRRRGVRACGGGTLPDPHLKSTHSQRLEEEPN